MKIIYSDNFLGIFYILITAILWSFIGILSKICLLQGLDPFQVSFLRSLFGFFCFFIHCYYKKSISIFWKDRILLIIFGVWGIGVYYCLAQYTILLAGACMDIILQYTAPFWVAFFSWLFFKDRLRHAQVFAMTVAAIGTLCVCFSGGSLPVETPLLGIFTGLVTGICYATHYPFTRLWQKKYDSSTIFMYMLAGGMLALFFYNFFVFSQNLDFLFDPFSISWKVWLSAAFIGIFCTYFAFVFFGLALKKIGLVHAVITSEVEPVFSMFWVCMFYDERFSVLGWIGSFCILMSVLLLSLKKT